VNKTVSAVSTWFAAILVMFVTVSCAEETAPPAPAPKAEAAATPEQSLRARIIDAAGKKADIRFTADVLGMATRVKLTAANANGITADAAGAPMEIVWADLSAKRFLGLAAACVDDASAADHILLAKYAIANDMKDEAEKELNRALELDAQTAETVKALMAQIKPETPKPEAAKPEAKPEAKAEAAKTEPVPVGSPMGARVTPANAATPSVQGWTPTGLSGGGSMFCPTISAADPMLMMTNCDMSGAYISTDGGQFWKMIPYRQLQSNTRVKHGLHPKDVNIMYAAQGDSIKISRNKGETWEPYAKVGAQIRGEIMFDFDNPALMLCGTDNGAAISYDDGKTWKMCEGVTGEGKAFHVDRTSPMEKRIIFAGTAKGIWRSDDNGTTWVEKMNGLPEKEIVSFAGGSDPKANIVMLYCSVPGKAVDEKYAGGIYRSKNRGETWEWAMGNGIDKGIKKFDEYGDQEIAQFPFVMANNVKPLTVLAANRGTGYYPPHHPTIYRSEDAGDNWRATLYMDQRFPQCNMEWDYMMASRKGKSYQPAPWCAVTCPVNPDIVIRISSQCYITHNGGKTWFNGHSMLAPGQKYEPGCFFVNTGLVVTSTWNYYVDPFQHNRHYICYTDIGFARSLDSGKTWSWWEETKWTPWRNTTYELAFDPEIPGKIWSASSDVHDIPNDNIIGGRHWKNNPEGGPGGVCLSTDFGESWTPCPSLPVSPVCSVVLDPKSPKGSRTLYAAVLGKGVFKSVDDGKTWTNKSNGLGHPTNMRVYKVVLHADGTLFAMITAKREKEGGPYLKEGMGLYRSKDSGENWELITKDVAILWPKDFNVHPTNSKIIFIGTAATRQPETPGGLYRTTDGGATWQQMASKGRQHFGAYFHPKKPDWVYMTMCEGSPAESSLWLSTDGGTNWRALDTFPFANTQRVTVDPDDENLIYVTTFGGSVFRGPGVPKQ